MADTVIPSSEAATPNTPPSSATEQARIRKERREAKIKAGGSARLNKITGLGGGVQRDAAVQQPATDSHADPDEVDISEHFYQPASNRRNTPQAPNDDQLRQMMLGFDPSSMPQNQPGANPFAGFSGIEGMGGMGGGPGEDPIMKMMQQMMGGIPGEGADGMPSFPGMPSLAQQAPADSSTYIWHIIHAVFALALGLYVAVTTPFTGSRLDRVASATSSSSLSPSMIHFFYIFATAEVLLQTCRFVMEKGRIQQGGIMGMVMGFLPEPYKGYLGLVTRYSRIWTTISEDAMVLVFVLGVCAWLRG